MNALATYTLSPVERAILRMVASRWCTLNEVFYPLNRDHGWTLEELANAWWKLVRMNIVVLTNTATRQGYLVGVYGANFDRMIEMLGYDQTLDIYLEVGR